eukprot:6121044-Ditylum_brightwellii.AAC.1
MRQCENPYHNNAGHNQNNARHNQNTSGGNNVRAGRGRQHQNQGGANNYMIMHCHLCGVNQDHNSQGCTAPCPGHQFMAMFQNMMGNSMQGIKM